MAAAVGVLLNCVSRSRSKRRPRQQPSQPPIFIDRPTKVPRKNRFNYHRAIILVVVVVSGAAAIAVTIFSTILMVATTTSLTMTTARSSFFPVVRHSLVDALNLNEASFLGNDMKPRQRQRLSDSHLLVRRMSSSSPASATDTVDTSSNTKPRYSSPSAPPPSPPHYPFPMSTRYKYHPALSNVALAQSLWSTVVRPGVDCAIDATCGNGHDSVAIANLLFPSSRRSSGTDGDNNNNNNQESSTDEVIQDMAKTESQLICLDVQERAVMNTTKALSGMLPRHIMEDNVRVLHASHEFLPRPRAPSSSSSSTRMITKRDGSSNVDENKSDKSVILPPVGLIVYNLGWLPSNHITGHDGEQEQNHNQKQQQQRPRPVSSLPVDKACTTQMETTISSLCDAVRMIRVGGMVSVVTYPKTNPDEDKAVQLFMTCLALLSSNIRSWEDEINDFILSSSEQNDDHDYDDDDDDSSKDDDGGGSGGSGKSSGRSSSCSSISSIVRSAMERVTAADGNVGGPVGHMNQQTFRVASHNRIGMDRAPILITATRIK